MHVYRNEAEYRDGHTGVFGCDEISPEAVFIWQLIFEKVDLKKCRVMQYLILHDKLGGANVAAAVRKECLVLPTSRCPSNQSLDVRCGGAGLKLSA
ncbi:hypothetical protein Q9966_010398 [Columba livia]|nr:hypothetical protein Q9966_010398 [Columba livia]